MNFDTFRFFGFLGMGLIGLGVLYSSIIYRGKEGEKYSLLNHFISELGQMGVTPGAWAFNLGLILGGVLTIPYILGLGIKLGSVLGWLGVVAGLLATLGVAAVGVFPMNKMDAHVKAAMTYFRSGLVMVLFFGLAILFQSAGRQVIPPVANILSLLAFLVYTSFLFLTKPPKPPQEKVESNPLDPAEKPARPRVWLLPILEWAVFFSTLLWLFGMAFFI